MELEVFVSAELSLEALVGALEQQRLPSNLPTDRLQALLARASTLLRERMADEDGGMGEEEQGQTPRAGSARGARRQIGSARDNRLNRRRAPSIGFAAEEEVRAATAAAAAAAGLSGVGGPESSSQSDPLPRRGSATCANPIPDFSMLDAAGAANDSEGGSSKLASRMRAQQELAQRGRLQVRRSAQTPLPTHARGARFGSPAYVPYMVDDSHGPDSECDYEHKRPSFVPSQSASSRAPPYWHEGPSVALDLPPWRSHNTGTQPGRVSGSDRRGPRARRPNY